MLSAHAVKLQPFFTPVNHNTLISAKAIQIVHTLMGIFCHGNPGKVSQFKDMGNYVSLIMGYHDKVSSKCLYKLFFQGIICLLCNQLVEHNFE
jgi:hypothetical protein